MIPHRLEPGPIDIKSRMWSTDEETRKRIEELQKKPDWRLFSLISLYWMNGKRSIYDIGQLVEIEMGHCILGDLIEWFSILERLNYIKISRS
jgi:hypothetical protein